MSTLCVDPVARAYYCRVMGRLADSGIPFLVGGAYAFERYTGISRNTKDFDLFLHPRDVDRALEALAAAGCETCLPFPHWLAKASCGEDVVDIIFSSGNGIALVDDTWFHHSVADTVLGVEVRLIPPEEMIWSKAFIMERERFDGGDVVHLLHARAHELDWERLLRRFGQRHYRVLLTHLVLFGFIYPNERDRIPNDVMGVLIGALEGELHRPPPPGRVCQGTLLSRAQFQVDVNQWGYQDARTEPDVRMTDEHIAQWTDAIADEIRTYGCNQRDGSAGGSG